MGYVYHLPKREESKPTRKQITDDFRKYTTTSRKIPSDVIGFEVTGIFGQLSVMTMKRED